MNSKVKNHCQPCEAESFTRNNYFTGKLMVERDFTDEQRYFREKIRLHHQRLHGSGVVCGLKIVAHSEPCDNRYVVLQPGSAVDCCGQDILVAEEDVIDLLAFPAMQALIEQAQAAAENPDPDASAPLSHTLQLCIRYKECPTEDIPVLYDECGCDDTQCAPNRILESYELGLLIDPEILPQPLHQPSLHWEHTLNLAHAAQIVLHEATQRLYVLTADDSAVLYQVSTNNFAVETSYALGQRGLAMTLNQDGTALYVILANSAGIAAGNADLQIFDTAGTQLSAGPLASEEIVNSENSLAQALILEDDRLLVLFGDNAARLKLWDAGVATPATPANEVDLTAVLQGLAQGSDGAVYSAEPGSGNIHVFDISAADFAPSTVVDSSASASVLAVLPVIATGPDVLALVDDFNLCLRVLDPASGGTVLGSVALAHKPQGLVISEGGHWAYVLERDGDESFVQSVNIHALRMGNAVVAGAPLPLGDISTQIHISASAQTLFVPYIADAAIDDAGGVAVIGLSETNCRGLLWPEDCPDCDSNDCLVLATIENYQVDFRLLDIVDPPSAPLDDMAAGIARINNALGRKRLPSTQAIAEALQCLLDNCCGGHSGSGEQGPPGPQGPVGPAGADGVNGVDGVDGQNADIDGVEVETIPCDSPAGGELVTLANGDTILRLRLPNNCNANLVHICNISWPHAGTFKFQEFLERGLLIRFDGEVLAKDLHHHSVRLLMGTPSGSDAAFLQYVELNSVPVTPASGGPAISFLEIIPLSFDSPVCSLENPKPIDPGSDFANGVWLRINPAAAEKLMNTQEEKTSLQFRVQVVGDFIRDKNERALDGNHLPGWVPIRKSGNRIQGGTFESYFTMDGVPFGGRRTVNPELNPNVNATVGINYASYDALVALNGVGPEIATAIVNARSAAPIKNETELRRIAGIGKSLATRLRDQINFDEKGE